MMPKALSSRTLSSTESRSCRACVVHVSSNFGIRIANPSKIRCVVTTLDGSDSPGPAIGALATIRPTSAVVAASKTLSNSLTLAAPGGRRLSSFFAKRTRPIVSSTKPRRGKTATNISSSRSRILAANTRSARPPRDNGT